MLEFNIIEAVFDIKLFFSSESKLSEKNKMDKIVYPLNKIFLITKMFLMHGPSTL